jgi:hypothetical protein
VKLVVLPVHVADDQTTRKRFHALRLASLDQWPATLTGVAPSFGLLLACDADPAAPGVIADAAGKALASGVGYVVAWGPGCEKVHDAFDETYVLMKLEQPDLPSVMTTWHTDDSLDEALWFFADAAQLPTRDESTDWLAVSVGCPAWANCIRQRLADLTSLRAAVLADHDESGSLR